SDWNWWYGPEHHSANDRDFDELYRKHLSNVYLALGAAPPDVLAQPIVRMRAQTQFTPQTAYIHPEIDGRNIGYFDWLGAATHVADRHSSAMHGKLFLLDTGYAGIDEHNLYCRLDFMEPVEDWSKENTLLVITIERREKERQDAGTPIRLEVEIAEGQIKSWKFADCVARTNDSSAVAVQVRMESIFEMQIPLELL